MPVHAPLTAATLVVRDDQRELGPDGDRRLVELLGEVFGSGRVLDAGGGTGRATRALAAAGARPLLLDVSRVALDTSRGASRVRADVTALPLDDASVDGLHAAFVLQVVPGWRRAVAECARVVRPGGALLVAWGGESPDPLMRRLSRRVAVEMTASGGHLGTADAVHGLTGVADGDAELADVGCRLVGEVVVPGVQQRAVRQLVERLAANPFRWRATALQRERACAAALSWASRHVGDVDAVHEVLVERRYRRYVRA